MLGHILAADLEFCSFGLDVIAEVVDAHFFQLRPRDIDGSTGKLGDGYAGVVPGDFLGANGREGDADRGEGEESDS